MSEHRARSGVAADHPCFAGHFPGRPLVPGVLLLDLIADAVLGAGERVAAIPAVKFLHALQPDQAFDIVWSRNADELRFRCECGEREIASGRMRLDRA